MAEKTVEKAILSEEDAGLALDRKVKQIETMSDLVTRRGRCFREALVDELAGQGRPRLTLARRILERVS